MHQFWDIHFLKSTMTLNPGLDATQGHWQWQAICLVASKFRQSTADRTWPYLVRSHLRYSVASVCRCLYGM